MLQMDYYPDGILRLVRKASLDKTLILKSPVKSPVKSSTRKMSPTKMTWGDFNPFDAPMYEEEKKEEEKEEKKEEISIKQLDYIEINPENIVIFGNIADNNIYNYLSSIQKVNSREIEIELKNNENIIMEGLYFNEHENESVSLSSFVEKYERELKLIKYGNGNLGLFGNKIFKLKSELIESLGHEDIKYYDNLILIGPVKLKINGLMLKKSTELIEYINVVNDIFINYNSFDEISQFLFEGKTVKKTTNMLYELFGYYYNEIFVVFGNLIDHLGRLESLGGVLSSEPLEIDIEKGENVISDGYLFDYDEKIEDYVEEEQTRDLTILEYTKEHKFGIFGNLQKFNNNISGIRGVHKKYLIVEGPAKLLMNAFLFEGNDIQDVIGYINTVNARYLNIENIDEIIAKGIADELFEGEKEVSEEGEKEEVSEEGEKEEVSEEGEKEEVSEIQNFHTIKVYSKFLQSLSKGNIKTDKDLNGKNIGDIIQWHTDKPIGDIDEVYTIIDVDRKIKLLKVHREEVFYSKKCDILGYIKDGKKTVEGIDISYKLNKGDIIIFYNNIGRVIAIVTDTKEYKDVDTFLKELGHSNVYPCDISNVLIKNYYKDRKIKKGMTRILAIHFKVSPLK